jgi:DNA-binding transcriptional ArsR family regulator
VLREAGLVTSEVRGQRRVYRLDRAPLAELDAWLERFRPLPGRGASAPLAPPGLINALDALDTEIRRGRRRRADGNGDTRDDRSAG